MVSSVTPVKSSANEGPRRVNVANLREYESGCKRYRDCFRHRGTAQLCSIAVCALCSPRYIVNHVSLSGVALVDIKEM